MQKREFVSLVLMTMAAILMAQPVSAQQVRGVTDTEILIGQTGPQTGPAALWGAVARGSGLFFKGINDEEESTAERSSTSCAMMVTSRPKPRPSVLSW